MRKALAKRLVLAALGGLCLLLLWLAGGATWLGLGLRSALSDESRGIAFALDGQGRVAAVRVFRAIRRVRRRREEAVEQAPRPGEAEIVPGVGCCGVKLGDSPRRVQQVLGTPLAYGEGRDDLEYAGLTVEFFGGHVDELTTRRSRARTAEGIGVGSTREEIVGAYGALHETQVSARRSTQLTKLTSAAAAMAFFAFLSAVTACLLVGLWEGAPAPVSAVLACIGAALAMWLIVVPTLVVHLFVIGEPMSSLGEGFLTELARTDPFWGFRPAVAVVGLFAAGRAGSALLRLRPHRVYVCGIVGAGAAVTLLYTCALFAPPPLPSVWHGLRQWWLPGLLMHGMVPGAVLAACFLALARQRRRWWRPVLRALALPEPEWFERFKKMPEPTAADTQAALKAQEALQRFRAQQKQKATSDDGS